MRSQVVAMVFAPVLIPGLAACGSTPEQPSQRWICSDGTAAQTRYGDAADTLTLSLGDETLILERARSASGARYSNGRTVFWSKGREAFIERDGEIVHRECRLES